jgi:hypothetical protein
LFFEYERSQKAAFTRKNLPYLPKTIYMAQEVGEKLGASQVLL